jgi:transcriptional regulator of aroF, aroG, tyrA and aromatic amino acid transport
MIKTLGKDIGKSHLEVTKEALTELMFYDWPGNVRELQNVIERALLLAKDKIDVNHLMIGRNSIQAGGVKPETSEYECSLPVDLPRVLKKIENEYLKRACQKYKSSREIARALGISHTTVIKKMKQYEIFV